MKDLIERQTAIDALIKADYEFTGILSEPRARRFEQTINALPSAQPDLSEYSDKLWRNAYERGKAEAQAEIIRCRDCFWYRHNNHGHTWCDHPTGLIGFKVEPTDYCSKGVRRTDER